MSATGLVREGCTFDPNIVEAMSVPGIRSDHAALQAWRNPTFTSWFTEHGETYISSSKDEIANRILQENPEVPPQQVTSLLQMMSVRWNDTLVADERAYLISNQRSNPAQCAMAKILQGERTASQSHSPHFLNQATYTTNIPSFSSDPHKHFNCVAEPCFKVSTNETRCWLCGVPIYYSVPNTPWYQDCEHVLPFLEGGFMLALAGKVADEKKATNPQFRADMFNLEYRWSHGLCNQLKNQAQFFKLNFQVVGDTLLINYIKNEQQIDNYLNSLFGIGVNETTCNAFSIWFQSWYSATGLGIGVDLAPIKNSFKQQARASMDEVLNQIQIHFNEPSNNVTIPIEGGREIIFSYGAIKYFTAIFAAHVTRGWYRWYQSGGPSSDNAAPGIEHQMSNMCGAMGSAMSSAIVECLKFFGSSGGGSSFGKINKKFKFGLTSPTDIQNFQKWNQWYNENRITLLLTFVPFISPTVCTPDEVEYIKNYLSIDTLRSSLKNIPNWQQLFAPILSEGPPSDDIINAAIQTISTDLNTLIETVGRDRFWSIYEQKKNEIISKSRFGRHYRKHSYSEQQIKLAKKLRIKLDKNINDNINKVLRVHAIAKKLRINLTTQNSKKQRIYKTPAKLISEIKSKLKK